MELLTRETFLADTDTQPRIFESDVWGGALKYRPATVADKAQARKKSTSKGELDQEKFECFLIVTCTVDPKLGDMDVDALMKKSATEINRYAAALIGGADDPTTSEQQ